MLSLLWGWQIDGVRPDRFDWLSCLFVAAGVPIMMYAPRP
ncbi:MAG: hypothetical protein ACTS2F_21200 [Thainema sp.]